MRYLLDTNIFIFLALDMDSVSEDVFDILNEPDAVLCMSTESVKELIVAFNNKGLGHKRWKTADIMVESIEKDFFIQILPLKKEHMETFSRLRVNSAQGHKDPSDHVIISHAITEKLPLVSSDTRFPFYKKQGLDLILNER
ncbi:MAG: PIN domain-containing protein [Prevotella sp.]|nr:PIN domain-containing protein [Prevotella sp.]